MEAAKIKVSMFSLAWTHEVPRRRFWDHSQNCERSRLLMIWYMVYIVFNLKQLK